MKDLCANVLSDKFLVIRFCKLLRAWFYSVTMVYLFTVSIVEASSTPSGKLNFHANLCQKPEKSSPTAHLAFVGDLLMHQPVQEKGYRLRDFSPLWRSWFKYFERADVLYANLELPSARGLDKNGVQRPDPGPVFDKEVHTTFPTFNIHPLFLESLKKSHFDILSFANNHTLDRGPLGIDLTIRELDQVGLPAIGVREANGEWRSYQVFEVGSMKLAYLACTMVLNSPDRQNRVLHCRRDWDYVSKLVAWLSVHTDGVIVTPHWGEENMQQASAEQKKLAQALVDSGAFLVVGAHPHVLQPLERLVSRRTGKSALVAYSLGNFLGFNPRPEQKASMILWAYVQKGADGKAQVTGFQYLSAFIRNRTGNLMDIENIPLQKAVNDPAYEAVRQSLYRVLPVEYELPYGQVPSLYNLCP